MTFQLSNIQVQPGIPAHIGLDLSGAAGTNDSFLVQFELNGVRKPITPAAGSGSVNPTPISGSGSVQHLDISWDALTDLGVPRPAVVVFASLVSDPTTVISAPFPAPPRIDQLTVATGKPPALKFVIIQAASTPCSIEAQYSADAGPWLPATPSGVPPALPSSPAGLPGSFLWDAVHDLAAAPPTTVGVRVRATGAGDTGDWTSLTGLAYLAVLNTPPRIVFADQSPDAFGTNIRFTLADAESEPCNVVLEFTEVTPPLPPVPVWTPLLPLAGSQPVAVSSSPAGVRYVFSWDTRTQFAGRPYPEVLVRLTPSDAFQIGAAFTISQAFVPNFRVQVWNAQPDGGSPFRVRYTLKDVESDICSIEPAFSIDYGANWRKATPAAGAQLVGLTSSPAGVEHVLEWDALTDLGNAVHPMVIFRISPTDVAPGVDGSTQPFILNFPPSCSIRNVIPADPTIVEFDLQDQEADVCWVEVMFSRDGVTWTPATESQPGGGANHLLSTPGTNRHAFAWDARHDLGSVDVKSVLIAVIPKDLETGSPAVSSPFDISLSPNAPPQLSLSPVQPGSYKAFTVVGVNVSDAEADPAFLELEYSLDTGKNWHPATVAAPALAAGPLATSAAGIHYDLQWDAWADLGEALTTGVLVQVLAREQQSGSSAISPAFDVDTRPPQLPVISNVTLDPIASTGPVVVSFTLAEPESRDCSIQALASIDSGQTWKPATANNTSLLPGLSARPATAAGLRQYFSWDVVFDLGAASTVRLRLIAATTRTGAPVDVDFSNASLPAGMAPPPSIVNATASQAGPGEPVLVSFTAVDRGCRQVFVSVQYADSTGAANSATDLGAANGGSLQGLAGTPDGVSAVFAWDAATDLHGTAGSFGLLLTPRAFGLVGTPVPIAALAVNASPSHQHAPELAALTVRPAGRDGTVELRFGLSDLESDLCAVTAQWQDPATATLKPATLLPPSTGLTATAFPAPASVRWNAVADLGPGKFTGYRLSLVANDGLASQPLVSAAFDMRLLPAHPRALAATAISLIAADKRQPVSLSVVLADPLSEYSSMTLRFALAGRSGWLATTILKDFSMQASAAGSTRGLLWDISRDFPAGNYAQLRVEATPLDFSGRPGPAVRSNPFSVVVWPAEAQPPVGSNLQLIPGAKGDPVTLSLRVADAENLLSDLLAEYSTDGGNRWSRASLASQSRGLAVTSQGTGLALLWNARADLPDGHYPNVRGRVTPRNPWPGAAVVSPTVTLDLAPHAAVAPSVTNLVSLGAANDELGFSASLVHPFSAPASIDVRFSLDAGATWQEATPGHDVDRLPPGGFDTAPAPGVAFKWWWNLAADLGPAANVPNALLRVTAIAEGLSAFADLSTGPLATAAAPTGNPTLAADPLVNASAADQVEVTVVVVDPASVPSDVALAWSTDGGNTWNPARGVTAAQTKALSAEPDGQEHLIAWPTRRDLAAQPWPNLLVKATCGASTRVSASFAIDLSGPVSTAPALSGLASEDLAPGTIAIDFTVKDDRTLTCSMTLEFTCQERPGWTAATEAVPSGYEPFRWAGSASGVDHRWVWPARRDLGLGAWHAIQVRLTASDGSQTAQATLAIGDRTFTVAPPVTQVTAIGVEDRSDSIRRGIECALVCDPPGAVNLRYSLVTATATTTPTLIGAPDQAYATPDGISLSLLWNAAADVSPAMDNQPQTIHVEAQQGATVVGSADLDAKTEITTRSVLPFVSLSLVTEPNGKLDSPIPLSFSISDPLARVQDLVVDYSRDGGSTWREATAFPGRGDGRQAFEPTEGSMDGSFIWDVERDIPERYAKGLQAQARLRSQPFLPAAITNPFDIDLAVPDGHAPTVFLTAADGSGPVVPVTVELYDPDGELVEFQLECFSPVSGNWFTATAADGSDLLTAALAQPAGVEYRYLWDAQADAAQIFLPGATPAGPVDLRGTVRKARAASLATTVNYNVNINASPYDNGMRDYPDIRPATLTITQGLPQTAVGGQLLVTPLTLKLVDKAGNPVANGEVQLYVAPGSVLSAEIASSVYTDDAGQAQVQVRPEAGKDGQLDLNARVVGSPDCQLAAKVSITVKAAKVFMPFPITSNLVVGQAQTLQFQFGSDDPNAGMSIAYGRPVQLQITSDTGRTDRRMVRLVNGVFFPGSMPGFSVDVVPQSTGSVIVTVAQPGATNPLFKQSFSVDPAQKSQRRIDDTTLADAQPKLVPLSGDDPNSHADGARWPAAGSEQWAWPGLTLTTPFRVKLLIDGKGDSVSPTAPTVTGPVIVDGPPPDPVPVIGSCDGVTRVVLTSGHLDEATATDQLKVFWVATGGTLSTSQTPSATDTNTLSADICSGVFFTPTLDGPWFVEARVQQSVLDPGRRYWTHTFTDASGQTHVEIHRGDALGVNVVWHFPIQQAPVFLVYNDAQTTEADRISAGVTEMVLARVSPSAGTTTRQVAINARQSDGGFVADYAGPRKPPNFNKTDVNMTLQSSGKELRSDPYLFVRGGPDNPTPNMLSFLRSSWVQVLAIAEPLVLATDPPLRARLLLDGRPSVQDAVTGLTPFAGWEGTVAVSDCEFVYPSAILDVVTAFGGLSLTRTWRAHLGWERRAWMNDDEPRVRSWAGAFGPGWIGSFETELVPTPDGYRFLDPNGRVYRIPSSQPSNGLIAQLGTSSFVDDDNAPIRLKFPNHGELRFHADGTLREMVDAHGHKTKCAYDNNSRLTSITDPHSHAVTFTPDPVNTGRVASIADFNQRAVAFKYQPAGAGNVEGMLGSSTGPAAVATFGGTQQSFQETYNYEGSTAAANNMPPYSQVRLKEILRAGESKIVNEHSPNGKVKTQTWNNESVKFIPGTGTTRYLQITFRDNSQQDMTFQGAGADAAAPIQIREFNLAAVNPLRTSNYRYNSQCRRVRAELPDNLTHRWTYDDKDTFIDIFRRGNLLAHEMTHSIPPPPPPPGSPAGPPTVYTRVESWEYTDNQSLASPTGIIPPESSALRTQRSWRTDVTYNQFGETVKTVEPAARSTRIALNGELFGPSPAPYTLDHKLDRPTTIVNYNDDGMVTLIQGPDGIVTEFAYFSLSGFSGGAFSTSGAGLLAQQRRDTTDTNDRQFWYLDQPVATRETLWKYDAHGYRTETTDSRGCRHTIAPNELGLPLRVETGIPAAGMAGQSVVQRTEYDSHWRAVRRILEQPGGIDLVEEVKEFDNEDRQNSVARTISAGETMVTKVRRGADGLIDGVSLPAPSAAQAKEIMSVDKRDERGLPVSSSLKLGRSDQSLPVNQAWDDHGAPKSLTVRGTDVQTYRAGPFGSIGGNTDPRVGLTKDSIPGSDGAAVRSRLTADGRAASRQQKRPAGVYGFDELRRNEWGLTRRVSRGLNARPGAGSGAVPGIKPAPAADGAPGAPPDWLGGAAATDKNDQGIGPGDGKFTQESECDILGRQSLYQDDRTNTMQTAWSPDGVKLRERVGERNQLAWNDQRLPWRDQRWRWQPSTDWTSELQCELAPNGDIAKETTTIRAGTVAIQRQFAHTFTYDSFGRVASVTGPLGGTTRYTHDVHGEIATMTDANGALDASGTTNVDGNKTTWTRDGLGRVVGVRIDLVKGGIAGPTAVSDGTIQRSFSYTQEGQITSVTDSQGFKTSWNYGPNGQLESVDSPRPDSLGLTDTTRQSITYDSLGRPNRRTMASGASREMKFNNAQQMEQVIVTAPAGANGTITYSYHPLGPVNSAELVWKRKEWTAAAGWQDFREVRSLEYDIDSNGRVIGELQHGTRRNLTTNTFQTVDHRIHYTYDGEGRRTGLIYSDDQTFRLDLDRTGRALGVIRGKEETILRYVILGDDFVQERRSGVVSEQRDLDAAGRLSTITVSANGSAIVKHDVSDRDRCGRIKTWKRSAVLSSANVDETRQFTYDSAGRIVHEETNSPTAGKRVVDRKFDGDGTVLSETRTDTPVSGPAVTRKKISIRGGGGAVFESTLQGGGGPPTRKTLYDLDGNVRADGQWSYEHDALGRLYRVNAHDGSDSTRYTYDSGNRLVACTRLDLDGNEVLREDYVWDEWRLVEVWRNGVLRERFVYGLGLNEIVRAEVNSVTWFPVYGADGSVDCVCNELGTVVESYAYDLDGAVTVFDSHRRPVTRAPQFRFGFHGHFYDPLTGLVYMRERWYSVTLAQFLEADLEHPRNVWSLYGLCNGNPIDQWDPHGRLFFLIPLVAVMLIGFAAGASMSLARQGAEMGDGTREFNIDWGQVLLAGAIGAVAAPILTVFPELALPLIAYGLYSGGRELAEGHYRTGAVDILSSLLPFATKGGRAAMLGRGSYVNAAGRSLLARAGASVEPVPPRTLASRLSPFWVRKPATGQTYTSTRTVSTNVRRLLISRTSRALTNEFERINTEITNEYKANLASARRSILLGDAREQHVAQLFGGRVTSGRRGLLFELFDESIGKKGGAYVDYTDVDVEVPEKELIFVGGPGKAKPAPHELSQQFFRQADLADFFGLRGRLVLFEDTPQWVIDLGIKHFGRQNVVHSLREPWWFVMDPSLHR